MTITSIIGTMIWGSSSRGVSEMAISPSRIVAMISSGVSLELMNMAASLVAPP
jgi:hypothetical protein